MKENQREENLIIKKKPEQLSRIRRFIIFLILYLITILTNRDQFIFFQHKKDLKDRQFSINNSFCHTAAIILGNILFIKISKLENRKKVTFICFFINGLLFCIYTLSENKIIFYCCRFLISLLKTYKFIFVPIWIDQIGINKYKTFLMFLYLHFDFGAIIQQKMSSCKWYLNSIIFGILILIFDCLLLIFPEKYFSLKFNFIGYKSDEKEEYIKSNSAGKTSFFEEKEENNNKIGLIKTIIKNKVYIFSILTNFFHFIFSQIITLNIFDYISTSSYFASSYSKFLMISTTKILASQANFLGNLFSLICILCLGGYKNKKSSIFLSICSIINFIFSLFLIFSSNSSLFSLGSFLYFFFSPSISFIIDCFIINLMPNKYKGSGFGLNLLLSNIGSIIAPIIYGLLHDYFQKNNPVIPWKISIIFILLETTFCLIASYYRYYFKEEIKDDKEKELEIIE